MTPTFINPLSDRELLLANLPAVAGEVAEGAAVSLSPIRMAVCGLSSD
jgi:hypothetical protein